jgi:hypothetical protein
MASCHQPKHESARVDFGAAGAIRSGRDYKDARHRTRPARWSFVLAELIGGTAVSIGFSQAEWPALPIERFVAKH